MPSKIVQLTWSDDPFGGPVDPGFGGGIGAGHPSTGPIYGGGYPSHGLPGGGYPSHGLPPPGHIATLPVFPYDPTDPGFGVGRPERPDNSLPGSGGRPDNSLPGEGGERPDNSLPGSGGRPSNELPVQIRPGVRFVVKWLCGVGLILVPDNSLPGSGAEPK